MESLPNTEKTKDTILRNYFKVNVNKCKHDESKRIPITITNKIVTELNSRLSLNVPVSVFLLFYSISYIGFQFKSHPCASNSKITSCLIVTHKICD